MKRILCLLLSAILLLSTAVFTVSAVADVEVKVNGVPHVSGNKICAVSVVELTLPAPVESLSSVKFLEVMKVDNTSTFERNFDGSLSADKKTITATFERGDISSNSKYTFEFDTTGDIVSDYSFTFETKMEDGVYFAENFSRYKNASGADIAWANGAGRNPANSMPIFKSSNVATVYISKDGTTPALKIFGPGNFLNMGVDPRYSAPLSTLRHIGENTVEFKMENYLKFADFAGITLTSTDEDASDGITMNVTRETTIKSLNGDVGYAAGNPVQIGTITFDSEAEAENWHTLKYVTDTTFTTAGHAYTKNLLKVMIDDELIWETDGTDQISMPVTSHNAAINQGFNKAVPALPAAAMQVGFTQLWSACGGYNLYIRYADYKDFKGITSITSASQTNAGISDPITIQFCDVPRTLSGSSAATDLAPEFATQISLTKVSDSSTVSVAIDDYDASSNSVMVTPNVPLEHNTAYKLTMASRNYKMLGTGEEKSYIFTTGWEKLSAETTATDASSTNFAPSVSVENITSGALAYDTILALYKTENGITNQVASVMTNQTSLAAGAETDIDVGTVSDPNPNASAAYFAKVFFVANGDVVANPVVIGAAPDAPITPMESATSVMIESTEPNTGRLDVNGKVVGSLPNRGLYVVVTTGTAPNISTVYYDVLSSGATGDFAFGFNLNPASGGSSVPSDYTVTVKPVDQAALPALPVNFDFSSVQPAITALSISGTPAYKETLTATYSVYDFVGRTDASVVEWWTAETVGGSYAKVGEGLSYTVPAEEVGKYIKCYVVPGVETGTGIATGTTYTTDDANIAPKYLASVPEASGVSITQTANSNKIVLTYTISDPLHHEQPTPNRQVNWKFKDASGALVKTIENSLANFYEVKEADEGLTIFAEVIPKITLGTAASETESCTDIEVGVVAVSNELMVSYYSSSSGSSSGSGGGGGGGGVVVGTGNAVEKESVPAYQAPKTEADAGSLDFTDVRGHWAEKEIFELYDAGIVTGRSEYEFDPDGQITRAEFMALLVRAMNLEIVPYGGSFGDVNADDWYAGFIETAYQNGLLEGFDGKANPGRAISREEMVTILVRAYEKACGKIKVSGGVVYFTDVSSISLWAQQSVIKATEIKLVNGTGDGRFAPKSSTTRAESGVVITRLLPHLQEAQKASARNLTETEVLFDKE